MSLAGKKEMLSDNYSFAYTFRLHLVPNIYYKKVHSASRDVIIWEGSGYCKRRARIANPRADRLPEKTLEPTLDRTTVEVGLCGDVGGEVAVLVFSTATFVKDDVQEVWAWGEVAVLVFSTATFVNDDVQEVWAWEEVEGLLIGLPVTRLTTVVDASVWVLKPTCGTVTVWEDQVRVVQGVSGAEVIEVIGAIGPVGEGPPVTCCAGALWDDVLVGTILMIAGFWGT